MTVMRLLALQSVVANGLPPKQFDPIRRELVQLFGFEKIPVFDRLRELRNDAGGAAA